MHERGGAAWRELGQGRQGLGGCTELVMEGSPRHMASQGPREVGLLWAALPLEALVIGAQLPEDGPWESASGNIVEIYAEVPMWTSKQTHDQSLDPSHDPQSFGTQHQRKACLDHHWIATPRFPTCVTISKHAACSLMGTPDQLASRSLFKLADPHKLLARVNV